MGQFVLLKHKVKASKARMVLRAEATKKVLFNAPILPKMTVNPEGKKAVSCVCVSYMQNAKTGALEAEYDGKLTKYVIKVKEPEDAAKLLNAIKAHI